MNKFWHVGLSVENLDNAISEYEELGLEVKDRFEKDEPRALAALMIGPSGSGVELWQWLDESHPQVEFIRSHVAFLSDEPDATVERLQSQGYEIVISKTVGKLVTYTFLRDLSGNFIEIAEAKEGYGS